MKTLSASEKLEIVNKINSIEESMRQKNATLVDEVELDMLNETLRVNGSKEKFLATGFKLLEGGLSGNQNREKAA